VSGSPSSAPSGVWMKKPLVSSAVTMLPLVTTVLPTYGEASPSPWIWAMVSSRAQPANWLPSMRVPGENRAPPEPVATLCWTYAEPVMSGSRVRL